MSARAVKMRLFAAAIAALTATPVAAGFDRWTHEVEQDPFSGESSVTVSYSTSIRSGVIMFCGGGKPGITIRAVPGYEFTATLDGFEPAVAIAVDGKVVAETVGKIGVVGANLAAAEATFHRDQMLDLLKAFEGAVRQIAIRDGMSDRPFLLTARGSTAAARAMKACTL